MSDEMAPILLVDDDEGLRRQLRWLLEGEHRISMVEDRDSALDALRRNTYAAVLLDLHLTPEGGDGHGLDVLRWISRYAPTTRVILLTGDQDSQMARETLRGGAWEFFPKPVEADDLRQAIRRALALRMIEQSGGRDRPGLERFGGLVTANPEMGRILRAARALAVTPLPLLILGSPGSGKSRLAREIHAAGGRETLVEAPAGTLPEVTTLQGGADWLLEQVEDLTSENQATLAGLLAGDSLAPGPGRVMATARRSPLDLARRHRFRPDLARRLETARLEIPPLSARREDLPLLSAEFLADWARERGRPAIRLTSEGEEELARRAATLQVGDLERLLRRAAERALEGRIGASALAMELGSRRDSLKSQRARLEAVLVAEALTRWEGNVTRAARDLGVSRPTLHDLMRKHALDPSRFRRS